MTGSSHRAPLATGLGDRRGGGARPASLRNHNLSLLARMIVHANEPPSRTELATITGLTRPTVTRLIDQLVGFGVVRELSPKTPLRAGRPAVPIVAAARSYVAIGLEVNVDFLRACLVDLTGRIIAERFDDAEPSDAGPEVTLARLGTMAEALATTARSEQMTLTGIGCAVPGLITRDSGRILSAAQLGWHDVDPRPLLGLNRHTAQVPIRFGNEASLAALLESALRSGRHDARPGSFVFVSGHVGVGGAVVRRGEIDNGERGWAGEIGHITVDPEGPLCACGARGCLERYAGKRAIMEAAGLAPDASFDLLIDALDDGEALAVAAVGRAGRALGISLAACVNLLDIGEVVLGGEFCALAPHLQPYVDAELADRVLTSHWAPVVVSPGVAGLRPAAVGAAWQMLDDLLADPGRWVAADREDAIS